jgi:hypothetical protein
MIPSDRLSRTALVVAALSAVLVAAHTRREPTDNSASRFAAIDALVHDHGFAIDHSPFVGTIDKVSWGGHYYSTKPPLLSVVGAGVYAVLHHALGLSLRGSEPGTAVLAVTVLLMLTSHLLLLYYGWRLLELLVPEPLSRLAAYGGLALGYLGLGYATTLNNHVPAAAVCLAGFTHAVLARRGGGSRDWLLAGFLGGLAPALDLGALFVSAAVGLYLLTADWRRALTLYAPAALPPLALHFVLTWLVSGSLLPIYLDKQAYLYPGSYWLHPVDLDALDEPRWLYLLNTLVGHHGLFALTPLFLLSIPALARQMRAREAARAEALVVAGALAALLVFYTATTRNYGGRCVGFRWLLPVMPLLFPYAGLWLCRARGRVPGVLFAALLLLSVVQAANCLQNPWENSTWHLWLAARGLA